jgi:hypothetical protein
VAVRVAVGLALDERLIIQTRNSPTDSLNVLPSPLDLSARRKLQYSSGIPSSCGVRLVFDFDFNTARYQFLNVSRNGSRVRPLLSLAHPQYAPQCHVSRRSDRVLPFTDRPGHGSYVPFLYINSTSSPLPHNNNSFLLFPSCFIISVRLIFSFSRLFCCVSP